MAKNVHSGGKLLDSDLDSDTSFMTLSKFLSFLNWKMGLVITVPTSYDPPEA